MTIKKPKPFVLVLMSFADDYDDVYQLGIKPACVAVGAVCERVDEQSYQSVIIQQIYDQIARADLIISDLSNSNLNVFYETGYAHALGKKVILLKRRKDKIPFNIGNYPHIVYERDKIAKLRSELERRAQALLSQPPARQSLPAAASKVVDFENVYSTRLEAATIFEEIVADKNIRTLYVVGISLRDLLTEHGKMHDVWKKVRVRLAKENAPSGKTPPGRRLQVRLLLLDPQSGEGFFRYKVEKGSAIKDGKVDAHDINAALLEIEDAVKKVYGDRPQQNLEARLYEHCPFSFLFLTNRSVFVEQYYFKSSDEGTKLPLVEYGARSAAYQQLKTSFDIIWENAHRSRICVGTSAPVERARLKNIFRVDDRDEQWRRQIECIRNAGAGAVDILSITGRFYSDREQKALVALKEISAKRRRRHARVRFALLNPVSQQAIFRAIADTYSIKQMRQALAAYSWEEHESSNLFSGVTNTLSVISRCKRDGYDVDLRLYSCSTANSFLITPESAFVGTYVYGRSREFQEDGTLKSEYPLVEYRRAGPGEQVNTEEEIIKCTFDIIWNYYSISHEDYKTRVFPSREKEFEQNLARVREELRLPGGA